MKFCNKCKTEKENVEFGKCKRNKDGLQSWCKPCKSANYKSKHNYKYKPVEVQDGQKYCRKCDTTKLLTDFHNSNKTKDGKQGFCKDCRNSDNKEYKKKNEEKVKLAHQKYYQENKEKIALYQKEYNQTEHRKQYWKEYAQRPEVKEYKRQWALKKYQSDPQYRLQSCFSAQIRVCIKNKNRISAFNLVSYTKQELIEHLEKQFDDNMTWQNYGFHWHIDHIIPKNFFDFSSYEDEDFKRCWALANLQPLKISENCSKQDKLPTNYKETLIEINKEIE